MKFLRKSPRTNLMKGYVCSGGWHKILHDTPRHTMTHHDIQWHTMIHDTPWHTMTHQDIPWHTMTHHDTRQDVGHGRVNCRGSRFARLAFFFARHFRCYWCWKYLRLMGAKLRDSSPPPSVVPYCRHVWGVPGVPPNLSLMVCRVSLKGCVPFRCSFSRPMAD